MRSLLLLLAVCGTVYTWSMSGYACNQPQLYQQCDCQSFCSGYRIPQESCGGECGGYYPRRRHRIRHHHKKPRRKFRFDSSEDLHVPPPPPPPPPHKVTHRVHPNEGFIEERPVSTSSSPKDSSWENEDLWEKKFVTESRTDTSDSDEFPEITSEEVENARITTTTVSTTTRTQGQGIGVNTGLGIGAGGGSLFGISSGVGVGIPGVGPIGISSGLGIGK